MLSTRHKMELRSKTKRMLCHISLPDSTVFELDFDSQSDGQEILNKVCERLSIIEIDYFGLMHTSSKKGERLWLNLRNRVTCEVSGSQPFRLELRVKFFIPPHMIQQDATRHHFYLNICEAFFGGRLRLPSVQQTAQFVASVAQVELGDIGNSEAPVLRLQYLRLLPCPGADMEHDETLLTQIGAEHARLSGTLDGAAKYRALQTVAELPTYGCCYHDAKMSNGVAIHVAVAADGIVLYTGDWTEIRSIDYTAIQKLTNDGLNVLMEIACDDASTEFHTLRLVSRTLASALYRAMTEKYYFYHCDTVGRDVMLQYCRDLKGTLASLFNEHTQLGKSYVFDIQRTMSEAYDRVRRSLFESSSGSICSATSSTESVFDSGCSSPARKVVRTAQDSTPAHAANDECSFCRSRCQCCQDLQETIQQYHDSLVCQMCYDECINTALVPCGHTMCCAACAVRLDLCPLCKSTITQRLKVYLPSVPLPVVTDNDALRRQPPTLPVPVVA